MTHKIRFLFNKWWKSLFIINLFLLLFVFCAVFWRMFAPIPSTTTWPDGDDMVVFYGDVFTTPLTQNRGLFFFDVEKKKLVRWESVETNPNGYADIAWATQIRQLLFDGTINSVYGLYLLDTEGNAKKIEPINLRTTTNHAISSDGEDIVFAREEGLYIQSIGGAIQQQLTDNDNDCVNFAPDWSPDNQNLVFKTYCRDTDISSVVRINRDGTNLKILTQRLGSLGVDTPKWSSNGEKIAFVESDKRYHDMLWIMNADGSNLHKILEPYEDGDTVHDFAWSSDSEHIIFVSSRDGFYGIISVGYEPVWTRSLYLIDVNTREITRLTHRWLLSTDLEWID